MCIVCACVQTQLICGDEDPLVHGARMMNRRLQDAGKEVELLEYPAHHAFIGFPIQWKIW